MKRTVWDGLIGQDRAVRYLRAAVSAQRVSHAMLFVGSPGSGKKSAAMALCCALVCDDACGVCAECVRIKRGAHPDILILEPEGVEYVIEQAREIAAAAAMTPVEAPFRVFIIEQADRMRVEAANALLKTIEEPPGRSVFILLAHTYDAVLPTISSRCQIVPFRRMSPSAASRELRSLTGANLEDSVAALAAAGGVVMRARDLLSSPPRMRARELILTTLKDLRYLDGDDILKVARSILEATKVNVTDAADEKAIVRQFLSAGAQKDHELKGKRRSTAAHREGISEILNVTESWLRDCMMVSQGTPEYVYNLDVLDVLEEVAYTLTPASAVTATQAVNAARRRISYNVNPQLAIEAMLFELREVFLCPR